MPEYNALQTARLDNFARRLLGVRNGGVLPLVSPEASVEIALPQAADSEALAGLIPWGGFAQQAAVAGEIPWTQITNGTTEGQPALLVLRIIIGHSAAPGRCIIAQLPTGTGSLGGGQVAGNAMGWRDSRRESSTSFPTASAVTWRVGTNPAIAGGAGTYNIIWGARSLASSPVTSAWITLAPGGSVVAWVDQANVNAEFGVEGYLREAVLPDELTV